MSEWLLISAAIVAISVIIGLVLVMVVFKKKKEDKMGEPNYQIFFIIGIAWIPIGIVFMVTIHPAAIAFMGMGIVYVVIGLANRDKWK